MAAAEVPIRVRHVMDKLDETYADLVYMSDLAKKSAQDQRNSFLSRALTAMVIEDLTGCSSEAACSCVIDGEDDYGIDGLAVDASNSHLFIVQTKWSYKGNAGFSQAAASSLDFGIKKIKNGELEDFNDRAQALTPDIETALANYHLKITIVLVLAGAGDIAKPVDEVIGRTLAELNEVGDLADVRVVSFAQIHEIVRKGLNLAAVDLTAQVQNWGKVEEPYSAIYGMIGASQVAKWYATFGERLFSQNIRKSLSLTEVNRKIRSTLTEAPGHFWYFNNGITILCDSFTHAFVGSGKAVGNFILTEASVVNGAQTVRAIFDSSSHFTESDVEPTVWIRFISLAGCPPGFAGAVTEATNTQNRVVARDFASLDPVQTEIREDFALSLKKVYIIKRGESDPAPENGCTIVDAARALAAAHADPQLAARAKQDDDAVLYEPGRSGTYSLLFHPRPSAFRIWRTVQVFREVLDQLSLEKARREGRAATTAEHADILIAHLVMWQLDHSEIEDPTAGEAWTERLHEARTAVSPTLDRVVHAMDSLYGQSSFPSPTYRSAERCQAIAGNVKEEINESTPRPELPDSYWHTRRARSRRANAVTLIVDSGTVADGTPVDFFWNTRTSKNLVDAWLLQDAARGRATWTNRRRAPLIWEVDGKSYSPSGLASMILRLAGIELVAVQGPSVWKVGTRTLTEVAESLRAE